MATVEIKKKNYTQPELIKYGTIVEITTSNSGAASDATTSGTRV